MQIILLETLNRLGKAGEIVNVKNGFAKNYLIPQKKAIFANKKNLEDLNSKMTQINENNEKKISEANEIKLSLEDKDIIIEMEANDEGNLYGNINQKLIIDEISNKFSIKLTTDNLVLGPIKSIGIHEISIRLYDDISTKLKLNIVKK
ncbi:MAG: 50S ribosomal protein L9 [Flavobacteriales bacterium]|nr:50S ribosomal protein L9 [Flavobacteriales bacterium]